MKKNFLFSLLALVLMVNVFAQKVNYYPKTSLDWQRNQTVVNNKLSCNAFGDAVFILDDYAIAGDYQNDIVYFFKRNSQDVWEQTQFLSGTIRSGFGESVCLTKNNSSYQAFVGAFNDIGSGTCSVFNLDNVTGIWNFAQLLTPSNPSKFSNFGSSIAIYENIAVIGSPNRLNTSNVETGAISVFKKTGSVWSLSCTFLDSRLHAFDQFGYKVSIYGTTIAVSAPNYDIIGKSDAGAVFTYTYNITTNSLIAGSVLYPSLTDSPEKFGFSLKLFNNELIAGCTDAGKVYCYTKKSGGALLFTLNQKLIAETSSQYFGYSLDFNSKYLVIGIPWESIYPDYFIGGVIIYEKIGSNWEKVQKEISFCFDEPTYWFGNCVSMTDNYIMIGAPTGSSLVKSNESKTIPNSKIFFYKRKQGLTADAGMDKSICPGASVTLGGDTVAKYGNEPYVIHWTDNLGWNSTETKPVVSPSVTTIYYLKVTDCGGNGNTVYDTIVVNVGAGPGFPVTIENGIIESMVMDKFNNVAIAGYVFNGVFPSNGSTYLYINGQQYVIPTISEAWFVKFVAKISSTGCVDFFHYFTTDTDDGYPFYANSDLLEFDSDGNLYMLMSHNYNLLMSDLPISFNSNMFSWSFGWLGKLDPAGDLVFSQIIDSVDAYSYQRLFVNNEGVNVLISDYSGGYPQLNHYSTDGTLLWHKRIQPHGLVTPPCYSLNIISSLSNGNIIEAHGNCSDSLIINEYNLANGNFIGCNKIKLPYIGLGALIGFNEFSDGVYFAAFANSSIYLYDNAKVIKLLYSTSSHSFSLFPNDYTIFFEDNCTNGCYIPNLNPIPLENNNGSLFTVYKQVKGDDIVQPNRFYNLVSTDANLMNSNEIPIGECNNIALSKINSNFGYYLKNDRPFSYLNTFNLQNKKSSQAVINNEKNMSNIQTSSNEVLINDFEIYPNPSTGKFTLHLSVSEQSSYILNIYSPDGARINVPSRLNNSNIEFDISKQPCGIYFITLEIGNKHFSSKVVKN